MVNYVRANRRKAVGTMRFKGVLFDAGEVLVHRDLRLLQRLAALVTGQRFVEDSVRLADRVAYNARLQEINAGGYDASWSSSQARLAFVAERMILELYPDARPSQVSDFQTRFYHLHMEGKIYGRTASDVRAALERLQSAGMIRTVLSNADGNLNRVLQHCEILDLFDGTIDSHQIGLSKPHPDDPTLLVGTPVLSNTEWVVRRTDGIDFENQWINGQFHLSTLIDPAVARVFGFVFDNNSVLSWQFNHDHLPYTIAGFSRKMDQYLSKKAWEEKLEEPKKAPEVKP